jgi:hypothetical protein
MQVDSLSITALPLFHIIGTSRHKREFLNVKENAASQHMTPHHKQASMAAVETHPWINEEASDGLLVVSECRHGSPCSQVPQLQQ